MTSYLNPKSCSLPDRVISSLTELSSLHAFCQHGEGTLIEQLHKWTSPLTDFIDVSLNFIDLCFWIVEIEQDSTSVSVHPFIQGLNGAKDSNMDSNNQFIQIIEDYQEAARKLSDSTVLAADAQQNTTCVKRPPAATCDTMTKVINTKMTHTNSSSIRQDTAGNLSVFPTQWPVVGDAIGFTHNNLDNLKSTEQILNSRPENASTAFATNQLQIPSNFSSVIANSTSSISQPFSTPVKRKKCVARLNPPATTADQSQRTKCPLCPATFSFKGDFKRHLRNHSGEKPYACAFCDKRFNRRDNAATHMKRHSFISVDDDSKKTCTL